MNRSNFNVSSLLCSRGNASFSKEPKCTFKYFSTIVTGDLTHYQNNPVQEIDCQSNAFFDGISVQARLVQHAHHFDLLACSTPSAFKDTKKQRKWTTPTSVTFDPNLALDLPTNYGTSFVDVANPKLFFFVAHFDSFGGKAST